MEGNYRTETLRFGETCLKAVNLTQIQNERIIFYINTCMKLTAYI
jgi:hypothetical protein